MRRFAYIFLNLLPSRGPILGIPVLLSTLRALFIHRIKSSRLSKYTIIIKYKVIFLPRQYINPNTQIELNIIQSLQLAKLLIIGKSIHKTHENC